MKQHGTLEDELTGMSRDAQAVEKTFDSIAGEHEIEGLAVLA